MGTLLLLYAAVARGCGGYHIGPLSVAWAKNYSEYTNYMLRTSHELGVMPELRWAPSVQARWQVMRILLKQLDANSVLDVGGIGTYQHGTRMYECINVVSEPRAGKRCKIYAGDGLPYADKTFDLVMAESTLHHAAQNASRVLADMARIARDVVVVAEDILEPSVSLDVRASFYTHDSNARYQSLRDWVRECGRSGLKLDRLVVLHRVPLHVADLPVCNLGYAPMVYMVFRHARFV